MAMALCFLEQLQDDEADVSLLRFALETPVSVDAVATEAWLRPGTPDADKEETTNSRTKADTQHHTAKLHRGLLFTCSSFLWVQMNVGVCVTVH